MTPTRPTEARAAILRSAREKVSREKRDRAFAAIEALEAQGVPISFTAVAAAAGVSRSLVYAQGVRDRVEIARARQIEPGRPPATPRSDKHPVTHESLRTDLAVAREQIRQLRAGEAALRARLRLQLGVEMEAPEQEKLVTRVAELEAANRQLVAERDAKALETVGATRRIVELEDELSAARESLRRVIREQNRPR